MRSGVHNFFAFSGRKGGEERKETTRNQLNLQWNRRQEEYVSLSGVKHQNNLYRTNTGKSFLTAS